MSGATQDGGAGHWALLADPAWQAMSPDDCPPTALTVGGWLMDGDGVPGPFLPNPDYQPSTEDALTDPTDAVVDAIAVGEQTPAMLIPILRAAFVELAVDEQDRPMVGLAPDGVRCVAVATAAPHRRRTPFEHWWQGMPDELLDLLPDGVDILLNPASPVPFRLTAAALREATIDDPDNERAPAIPAMPALVPTSYLVDER